MIKKVDEANAPYVFEFLEIPEDKPMLESDFTSHCFDSVPISEKNCGSGEKAGQDRRRDYHGERKGWCREPPQKVQRYDWVARNQRNQLFL